MTSELQAISAIRCALADVVRLASSTDGSATSAQTDVAIRTAHHQIDAASDVLQKELGAHTADAIALHLEALKHARSSQNHAQVTAAAALLNEDDNPSRALAARLVQESGEVTVDN